MAGDVYRLYLEDGTDVGEFVTAGWGFKAGNQIWDGQHREWRIVSVAPAIGDKYRGLFTVEPARQCRGHC